MQAALLAILSSLGCLHCGSDATPNALTSGAGQTGASAGAGAGAGAVAGASSSAGASSAGSSQGGASASAGTGGGSASASASAGTSASGASAGGSAGSVASGACADRTICEDFEKLALGSEPASPFSIHKNNGTVSVDGTHVHSGKQALKVSTTATTSASTYRQSMLAITGAPLLPLANDGLYGRFMIYTDRIPDKSVHWTIAHGDGPYQTTTATYNYGGMGGLMANYYRDTKDETDPKKAKPTDCWQSNTQAFPTDKWTCVAFHFDGKNNEMQFWIDGKEITDLHVLGNAKTAATCVKPLPLPEDGKWYAPAPFKNISVGWESYQHDAAGAHDAWIDDLILDESPIACP